ncbi:MAG: OmpA family protein [Burkholderiales bacterium]
MRLLHPFAASLAGALIAGCQTTPSTTATTGAPAPSTPMQPRQPAANPATKSASTKANLAIEKLRLAELFRGTPVVFALQPDGSMRVEVPLQYSFDAGKAVVKPPLAAVLDRIAAGQRDELTQVVVHAPGEAAAKALAGERAASVREYLVGHGLPEPRVAVAAAVGAAVVRIVVADAAPM